MRFTWKTRGSAGKSIEGTCADQSQRVTLTKMGGGWSTRLHCGVTGQTYDLGSFVEADRAKQVATQAANVARSGRPVSVPTDDRIVYLVVTEPGGVDGRDASAKGGQILLATFNKAEAEARKDGWSRIETKAIDMIDAREKLLRKLSPLDLLVLSLAPVVETEPAPRQWDHLEGNRG